MSISYGGYLAHWGIKNMHWGVRRYQDKEGNLTPEGKKRYAKDIRENLAKKKDNRIDTSKPDPNRWVREDISRTKDATDATKNLVNEVSKAEEKSRPKPRKVRMDLSDMSDSEMREAINRERLELSYNDLFGPEPTANISKGRKRLESALEVAGSVLAVGSTALGIALAIKQLKDKD